MKSQGRDPAMPHNMDLCAEIVRNAQECGVYFVIDPVTQGIGIAGHRSRVNIAHGELSRRPELRDKLLEYLRQEDQEVADKRRLLALELAIETGL